ncbi:MAG TPA: FeoA family protein [Methanocorpusculum sp.]|nr:FeoA family protein [Methanocorpusculum sp.]
MNNTNESAIPLTDIKKGNAASIVGFTNTNRELVNRLLELGFIRGSKIIMNGKAPFGDPLILTIHGGKLALRKADAANIMVICRK